MQLSGAKIEFLSDPVMGSNQFIQDFHHVTPEEPWGLIGHCYIARFGGKVGPYDKSDDRVIFPANETIVVRTMEKIDARNHDELDFLVTLNKQIGHNGLILLDEPRMVSDEDGHLCFLVHNTHKSNYVYSAGTPFFNIRIFHPQ